MQIPTYAKPKIDKDLKIYSLKGLAEANKKKYGTELTNEIVKERDKNLKAMNNKELDQFIKSKSVANRINKVIK